MQNKTHFNIESAKNINKKQNKEKGHQIWGKTCIMTGQFLPSITIRDENQLISRCDKVIRDF